MAHKEQFDFVKKVKDKYPFFFTGKDVVEFGSLDLNGSVRQFFNTCDYTGVDIAKGNGVDVVSNCHTFCSLSEKKYDVVISCEMLEHDRYWALSLNSMFKILKQGGLIILTCAYIGRAEHGTHENSPSDSPLTNDHYRNLNDFDIVFIIQPTDFTEYYIEKDINHFDLFFYGIKK